jgi:hypothetical protein
LREEEDFAKIANTWYVLNLHCFVLYNMT